MEGRPGEDETVDQGGREADVDAAGQAARVAGWPPSRGDRGRHPRDRRASGSPPVGRRAGHRRGRSWRRRGWRGRWPRRRRRGPGGGGRGRTRRAGRATLSMARSYAGSGSELWSILMDFDRSTFGGRDLHLDLDGPGGRRSSLEEALREAIRSGRLAGRDPVAVDPGPGRRSGPGPGDRHRRLRPAGRRGMAGRPAGLGDRGGVRRRCPAETTPLPGRSPNPPTATGPASRLPSGTGRSVELPPAPVGGGATPGVARGAGRRSRLRRSPGLGRAPPGSSRLHRPRPGPTRRSRSPRGVQRLGPGVRA